MLTEPAHEDDVARVSPARWLLVLPFIAVLYVPFYNGVNPTILSVPLFYWYQLLWVLLCAVVIGIVYIAENSRGGHRVRAREQAGLSRSPQRARRSIRRWP